MLSVFRQQLARDLDAVFFNESEWAARTNGESHTIDGIARACILDDGEAADHTADGVFIDEFLLYMKRADLPDPLPVPQQRMTVDERKANIIHVDDMDGMVTIRLQWWDS